MTIARHPVRQQFETERRRASFTAFLSGMGIGVIAGDTWISPLMGVPGGLALGAAAYAAVYAYETLMWRRHHG